VISRRCSDQPSAKRRFVSFAEESKINEFLNEGGFITLPVLVWLSKMLITGLQCDSDLGRHRISSSEATSFPGYYLFLPRGRKREDPGNEVAVYFALTCYDDF